MHPDLRSTEADIRGIVTKLAKEAVAVHRTAVTALRNISTCNHGGRTPQHWVCTLCSNPVGNIQRPTAVQNPVLGRFINDLLRHGELSPRFSRQASHLVSYLIEKRTDAFEDFMEKLAAKVHSSSLDYWRSFGRIPDDVDASSTVGEDQRADTNSTTNASFVFPGRYRCRNPITFDQVDKQECTKHYFKGRNSVVPSFLTVQCACAHPKLIGFVVLNQCESISAALSAV